MNSPRDPLEGSPAKTDDDLGKTALRPSQPTAAMPVSNQPQPPPSLGGFQLDSLLGRGGMAAVYLAHDTSTGRPVALKLMDPGLENVDSSFVERFMQEARSSSELHHPNVVELISYGTESGWRYLATEFVDRGTVGNLLRQMGSFPAALVIDLLAQLLSGLVHSHERGLIHRDLKPENLLLTSTGVLKIADFGIARSADQAKLTRTGMMVGTAGYMSPEQARGEPLDGRSDLFSVGVIVYEMLTGVGPFECENPATSITRILTGKFAPVFTVNPCVPAVLEGILDRLLRVNADERFASAQAALDLVLPLAEAERRRKPQLAADALRQPRDFKRALDVEAAAGLLLESQRGLENASALTLSQAALKAHLALQLDPGNLDAATHLEELGKRTRLNFGPSQNPRISELERLAEDPNASPALFTQLAQLYRVEGNPLKAVGFLKQYLRIRPDDAYVLGQLTQLLGATPQVAIGAQTRELMAGIRTGGFKASQKAPSQVGPMTPAKSEPGLSALPMVETNSPLGDLARRFGPGLLVVVLLVLAVRWVVKKTDEITRDSMAVSDQLRRNLDGPSLPMGPLVPAGVDYDKQFAAALEKAARLAEADSKEEAITAYEEVMQTFPKRPRTEGAAFQRAKLLAAVGRNSAAREAFAEFLERYPASPDAPEALLRRGVAAANNLADADAEADLSRFLERHPSHALVTEAWVVRGEVFARKGATQSARADFEAAIARLGPSPLRDRAEAGLAGLPLR